MEEKKMSIVKISGQHRRNDGSSVRLSPKGVKHLEGILWDQGAYQIGENGVWRHGECNVVLMYGAQTSHENPPFDKDRPFLGHEVYGEQVEARKSYEKLALALSNACGRFNMGYDELEETLIR